MLKTALLEKPYATRILKHKKSLPRSLVKASGLSPIKSENVTSDVEGC